MSDEKTVIMSKEELEAIKKNAEDESNKEADKDDQEQD